jgi:cytochrome c oxidase assembly protein subunit 11
MQPEQNHRKTVLTILAIALGMFCLAFASFPLYNLFCKATGYQGTPKVAAANTPEKPWGKTVVTVRFNAEISPELAWKFYPIQNEVQVHTGEHKLIYFKAENLTDTPLTGVATYNITPEKAASYFTKIQCFCFTQQTLKPHEVKEMPVTFFVNPDIEKDPEAKEVTTMTLSYTFFPSQDKPK